MRKIGLIICFLGLWCCASEKQESYTQTEVCEGRLFTKEHRCKKRRTKCKRSCRSYMPWWSSDPRMRLLGYYDLYYDYNNPYPWYGPVPVSFSLDCCL